MVGRSSYRDRVSAPARPGRTSAPPAWAADALLPGYLAAPLGPATLVRPEREPDDVRGVVLHLHGYNDYFFQTHLVDALADAGFACWAVDLRRAGRSLLRDDEGLPAHWTALLPEFWADLDAAVAAVREAYPGLPLAVHAHSTGGLTAATWAHARGVAGPDALVLDSPFLDLDGSWLARAVRTGLLEVLGRTRPLAVVSTHPSVYATYQHVDNGGRWDFDTRLKRPEGQPARAAWLRTVRQGQLRVARGLRIACPVLVGRAAASGPDSVDNPLLDAQDTVLDTVRIGHLAPRLGADVTQLVVDGGVHDLMLSAEGPRAQYLAGVTGFLDRSLRGVR
ncbi:Alpha/beta hydrolase family protein [Isoptericola dokdonensis DS-3]|uniref:Alpha/beta hydrolase family protein n=1 Tax=Isoptericola dokdonensis DS-3 TaxID=1300344 RepID=A0A168EKU6_9MICO|nr:Alpha/beta hydrolase family protein [Isoptericola dokdonensis DS-3]